MRNSGDALPAHLRSRTFYSVHGAEEAVNVLFVRLRLQRQQAIGDDLQMLLNFGDEELQHFVGNILVGQQLRHIFNETFGRSRRRRGLRHRRRCRIHGRCRRSGGGGYGCRHRRNRRCRRGHGRRGHRRLSNGRRRLGNRRNGGARRRSLCLRSGPGRCSGHSRCGRRRRRNR